MKELNIRLQNKIQHHGLTMSGTGPAADHNAVGILDSGIHTGTAVSANTNTNTGIVVTALKSTTGNHEGGYAVPHMTRFHLDDGIIPVDSSSDSEVINWSITRNSKASASDIEPFC